MRKYRRFTYNDRLKLEALYNTRKFSLRQLATELGFTHGAIRNELNHGYYDRLTSDYIFVKSYSADIAQNHADFSITTKRPDLKVGNDHKFIKLVEDLILKQKKSPDEVIHIIRNEHPEIKTNICIRTLYNYINSGLFPNLTNKDLFFKGKRYRTKPKRQRIKSLPHGLSIEKRPQKINDRSEFGHWEMDSVIGKKTRSKTFIVLTERKTRFEIVLRSDDKSALSTVKVINRLERIYRKNFLKIFKSITVDNGTEFSNTAQMEASCFGNYKRTTVYHCHPYSSYERGSNENQNRYIRLFVPKGTDIGKLSNEYIQGIQKYINTKRRKMFNYRTSEALFFEELAKL